MKKTKNCEPKYLPSPLNTPMLNYKEYHMSAAERLAYTLLVLVVGGFVGWIFYGGLFKAEGEATTATYISNMVVMVLFGMLAVKFFLPAIQESLLQRRYKALRLQFRDMLETITALLASGNTVNDAFINAHKDLQNQYSQSDYIIVELGEIIAGIHNGQTLEYMLASFAERSANADIQNFANVIENCYRIGGNFKVVVRKTKDIISDKMIIEEEVATKIASNKMQHNVMCIMPIALVALLKLMNESFAENLASVVGVLVTTIAIAIFISSYFWGRKIVDIR